MAEALSVTGRFGSIITAAVAVVGCATTDTASGGPKTTAPAMILPGEKVRALVVAVSDYIEGTKQSHAKQKAEMAEKMLKPEYQNLPKQMERWERPDGNDVEIEVSPTSFKVVLVPNDLCGQSVGGGAVYEIDRKTFAILKRDWQY